LKLNQIKSNLLKWRKISSGQEKRQKWLPEAAAEPRSPAREVQQASPTPTESPNTHLRPPGEAKQAQSLIQSYSVEMAS
jgi:hypothetical protein